MTANAAIDETVLGRLPEVRGVYRAGAALAPITWFRVGGPADVLFLPKDADDVAHFLKETPADIPVTAVGVGSNLLVRDGGIPGVVVRLAKGFADIAVEADNRMRAGAAVLDVTLAKSAAEAGIAGLEFYRGIPGTVGGALRMNAGSYGSETEDVLVEAVALDRRGNRHELSVEDMGYAYRHSSAPEDLIFIEAVFQGVKGSREEIEARMDQITSSREATQPVRTRTGGSTFKNPDGTRTGGRKAWRLIEAAGCRGLRQGGAQVSELHCNFLVNHGQATAADLERLGEEVRRRVKEASGVTLEWEIRRMGRSE